MKAILQQALARAAALGADYADIRVKDITTETIRMENGTPAVSREESYGCGARVYLQSAMGFAASGDPDGLAAAVDQAAEIAAASRVLLGEPVRLAAKPPAQAAYATPVVIDPFTVGLDEKLALLRACDQAMREVKGIGQTFAGMDFRRDEVTFADTEGSYIRQTFCQSGAAVRAAAVSDDDTQERNYHHLVRAGYEAVRDAQLPRHAARAAREAVELLAAPECPSGVFDIILTPRQLFLQVHESVGHPTELDRVLGSEAAFAGASFVTPDCARDGLVYGSSYVNIVADATCPLGLGTFAYDDEGVAGGRYFLVKKGAFVGYQTSRDNAPALGQPSRGMGLADGWRNLPIVRMTNINLLPGAFELGNLIAGIEDGLLLDENKSWSIDDKRVNFQFACEMAQEIKNGRLTGRIFKNPIYAGQTTAFWQSCDGVCNEKYWRLIGVPNCGKGQPMQVMRVSHGSSPARFRQVQIGVSHVK